MAPRTDQVKGLRTLGESENRAAIVRCGGIKACIRQILPRENRQVLRDYVAEVGAKYAYIETPAVAQAQNGLGIELIRSAETGAPTRCGYS